MIASVIPQVTTMAEGSSNNYIESDERSPATDLETDDRNISMPEQPIHVLKKEPHCKNKLPIGEEYVNDSKSTHTLNEAIVRAGMLELEECDREIPDEYFGVLEKPFQEAPTGKPSQRCRRILKRLFEEFGLKGLLVWDFGDRGIAVLGENAKTIEPQILAALRHLRFPNIEVVNKETDFEGVEYTEPLSCQVAKMVTMLNKWELGETVFCELVIQDDNTHGAIYAVIPAHLVLTLEQSRQLASVGSGISHTSDQVTKQGKEYKYVFKNENHEESVVLEPPPLLAYRHWEKGPAIDTTGNSIPEVDPECDESTIFMNDIALLKFQSYRRDELADKVEVFPIPTKKHLDALARRRQRVIIGKHEGMLIPSPESVGSMNHHYGLHLSFIITSKDADGRTSELESGSSGLIVFFKGKQGQLIPVGMLVGKLSARLKIIDSCIYQAIVLSQALKEIEQDYPQQISHIRVLETCHRSKGSSMVTSQQTTESAVQGDSGPQDTGAAASNMTTAQSEVKPSVAINKTPEDRNAELITTRAAESMQSEVKDQQLSTDHTAPLVERPEEVVATTSCGQKQTDTPPEISHKDDITSTSPEIQGSSDMQTDIPAADAATQMITSSKEENIQQAAYRSAEGVSDVEIDQSSIAISSEMVRNSPDTTLPMGVNKRLLTASTELPHQGSGVKLSDLEPKQWETPESKVISKMAAETAIQVSSDRQPNIKEYVRVAATGHSSLDSGLETIKESDDAKQSPDEDEPKKDPALPLMKASSEMSADEKRAQLESLMSRAERKLSQWLRKKLSADNAQEMESATKIKEQLNALIDVVDQSLHQQRTSNKKKRAAKRKKTESQQRQLTNIWYRHSGEPAVDGIRDKVDCTFRTFNDDGEILEDIGTHHITHMYVREGDVPSLNLVAPKLTALKVTGDGPRALQSSQLGSLKSSTELKELHIEWVDLSEGLPPGISQLTSLEKVVLRYCKLTDLPERMSFLSNLKYLDLEGSDFSKGLPEVITQLTSLETLDLQNCQLINLPASFSTLTNLEELFFSDNYFRSFPPEICELENLRELWLNENEQLESLHPGILSLSKLEKLKTSECPSLTTPSPNVSKQGLKAIKQYYKDLAEGEGRSLPAATVSVIGKSNAGKTSLIRKLQHNARVLTGSVGTGEDVSTKVFNFEEVEVENTKLRFIEFGGKEIYHLAFGLTLRENCVPVIVVNMEMYKEMSEEIGDREAVRRLYFDQMAHLYLSQPDLPAPKLVITHKDKFSPEEFEEVKTRFLSNSTSVRDSILSEESRLKSSEFHKIKHLLASAQMFHKDNTFEVGSEDDQDTFQNLKQQLLDHCKRYVLKVPRIWEEVEQSIQAIPTGFSRFNDLLPQLAETHEIEKEQLEIILTYMHYCGKLLWFKDVKSLSSYIFHKVSAVTELFNVLLDHDDVRKWEERLWMFQMCKILSQNFEKQRYLQSVEKFKTTGIVSSMLLAYLIHSETEFKSDEELEVALELLTTFKLTFGEVKSDGEPAYIVPHCAVGYSTSTPMTTSDIQLHVDLVFYGLPLPQYVYHEMTVELLKMFPDEMDAPSVKHNSAVVEVDESTICLTHDVKAGRATVSISSPTEDIDESWNHLIKVVNNIIQHVQRTWKVAALECVLYCAHCKLIGSSHPSKTVNPFWSVLSTAAPPANAGKVKMVKCGKEKVPAPFRFPCRSLSETDMKRLTDYVESMKEQRKSKLQSQTPAVVHMEDSVVEQSTSYSEYSMDAITKLLQDIRVRPTVADVKVLYNNTDQVYKMTSPRGMALMININTAAHPRPGADIDVQNMETMLRCFDFEVETRHNLSSMEMMSVIHATTRQRDKLEDYGMFVLVLMSHGSDNDLIEGADGLHIKLSEVYNLLCPWNCPAMAGKPKLVIVQACGGDIWDFGEHGFYLPRHVRHSPGTSAAQATQKPVGKKVHPMKGTEIHHLDTDDLIVIKASFNTYASISSELFGSVFISCLVHHFYKHAGDKDVETICKMIQQNVRAQSIELAKLYPKYCFGQTPFYFSMLTNCRKLYLFPGYNGE